MTLLFDFHLPTQNWVYFPEKVNIFSLQSILTWTVLSYQTDLKATKTGHDRAVVLAISLWENPAAASTSFRGES